METNKIKINGIELSLQRLNLKGWCKLDVVKREMDDAISTSDFAKYFLEIVQFIEIASSSLSPIVWEDVPWYDVLAVYSQISALNTPSIDFPVLHGDAETEEKKLPWEYSGRTWFFWLNLFARNYGWTENQVEHLDIDTALGLYQEVLITEQFEKEWDWGLSEVSTTYDKSTKSSRFVPLERPTWMKPIIPKTLPIVRMKREHLPMGNIIDLSVDKKHGV